LLLIVVYYYTAEMPLPWGEMWRKPNQAHQMGDLVTIFAT